MNNRIIARNEEVVIGVDVSDEAHHLAVVNMRGILLKDATIKQPTMEKWMDFIAGRLPGCQVRVVYEAGPHGYTLHDVALMIGCEVTVVTPQKPVGGVKTNKRDARSLARDFLAGRAKPVVVPAFEKRCRRQVLRLRDTLVKESTRLRNMINSMQRFHGRSGHLRSPREDTSEYVAFCIGKLNELVGFITERIKELERALKVIAKEEPWREDVKKLEKICGIGRHSALEFALQIADIRAFRNSGAFASHLGLCPGEWSTGEARRQGHITRRGPGKLRGLLVQCAWTRIRFDPGAFAIFEKLRARRGKKRAIVAIARRLAVQIWWELAGAEREAAAA